MVNHGRFMTHFGAREAFLQGIEGRLSRTYLWKWHPHFSYIFLHFPHFSQYFPHFSSYFSHLFPRRFHPLSMPLQSAGPSRSKAMLGKVGNQLVMCLLLNFNHYILERSSDTPKKPITSYNHSLQNQMMMDNMVISGVYVGISWVHIGDEIM